MLNERQAKILHLIVDNYISEAQAISSESLAEVLNVSSATLRNEMYIMTENDYLVQPHTSAGRIPSEKGWRYYVDNFMNIDHKISKKDFSLLVRTVAENSDIREQTKQIAKTLADLSGTAVMVAYKPRDMYYTGLTNLFSQPEFQALQSVVHISKVIDHLDDVMMNIFESVEDIGVAVGTENPFSPECSIIISALAINNQDKLVVGILGPMRMSYNYNYALLRTVKDLLNKK